MLGGGKRHNADSLVADLQAKGILNVIAEPNLTAITGQEASFLAGGEVPVPVPGPNGGITMTYKSYGVSLVFTPTIIKKNRIALHVHPEVSMPSQANAITYNGITIPGFSVRRTDTTIEVGSGQTFAIAGLIQQQFSRTEDDVSKMPIMGDLPIIGDLFRSPRFQRNETELVILITPYLVKPQSDPRAIALPTDRAAPAPQAPPPPLPPAAPPEMGGAGPETPEPELGPPPRQSAKDTPPRAGFEGMIFK